jgi:hypothetical protein
VPYFYLFFEKLAGVCNCVMVSVRYTCEIYRKYNKLENATGVFTVHKCAKFICSLGVCKRPSLTTCSMHAIKLKCFAVYLKG